VYLPESTTKEGMARSWVEPLVAQLCSFPEVRHDDLVDAMTQGLRILRDMGMIVTDYVYNDPDLYVDDTKPRRVNPYAI